ncbi:glycosyltransferase, partial [uncultured Parabacteroides sp.]|uniref:glycosyltransferase family 2 protein n=1 Tax=uncultured Parabacteroides sp. TaxID=512312 RepID=UPI00260D559D
MCSTKISIIVPIYNVEQYLQKTIESCINQTLKELEVILVDDGSKDASGKVVDDFAKKDNRIKVIHKQNEGVTIARNTGLTVATGKYIFF